MCGTGAGRVPRAGQSSVRSSHRPRPVPAAPPRAEGPFLRGRPRRRDRTAEPEARGLRDRRKGGKKGGRVPGRPPSPRASLTEGAGAGLSIRSSEEAGAGGGGRPERQPLPAPAGDKPRLLRRAPLAAHAPPPEGGPGLRRCSYMRGVGSRELR